MISFTIPGVPPSKNTMWRHDRGRTHVSPEYQAYKEDVMMITPPVTQYRGDLFIDIAIFLTDHRRDVHNCTDALLDSLAYAGLVKNDRQFKWVLTREAGVDKQNPRTIVTIGFLNEWKEAMIEKCQTLHKH